MNRISILISLIIFSAALGESRDSIPSSEILKTITVTDGIKYDDVIIDGNLDFNNYSTNLLRPNHTVNFPIVITNSLIEGSVDISNSIFEKSVDFSNSTFEKSVNFTKSKFKKNALFRLAKFKDIAEFKWDEFDSAANFENSTFEQNTYFTNSQFNGNTVFDSAHFQRNAELTSSIFSGTFLSFSNCEFNQAAYFGKTDFYLMAVFLQTSFIGDAVFDKSHFMDYILFDKSQFNTKANFAIAEFEKDASFRECFFNQTAIFDRSRFGGDANFNDAEFKGDAKFNESKFSAENNALFEGADFKGTLFLKGAKYKNIYVRWHNISKLAYDDETYLAIMRNFKDLGYFEDYDNSYLKYREERRSMPWPGVDDKTEFLLKKIDAFFDYAYGYGTKPLATISCILKVIIVFGFIWFFINQNACQKIFQYFRPIRGWLQRKLSWMSIYAMYWNILSNIFFKFVSAFSFSIALFLLAIRPFDKNLQLHELLENPTKLQKLLIAIEMVLGVILSALFLIAISVTVIRPIL